MKTLKDIKDGRFLRLAKKGVVYEMIRKEKKDAIISTVNSKRSYRKSLKTKCIPLIFSADK